VSPTPRSTASWRRLKRALTLAHRAERIQRVPYIEMLAEDNVRKGFFERDQFEAVRGHLHEDLRPVVTFAYITGWRIPSEVLTLQWRQIDFQAGTVRLEPGETKNREGRTFAMTAERAPAWRPSAPQRNSSRGTAGSCRGSSTATGSPSRTSGAHGRRRARVLVYQDASRTTSGVPPSAIWSELVCHVPSR